MWQIGADSNILTEMTAITRRFIDENWERYEKRQIDGVDVELCVKNPIEREVISFGVLNKIIKC